MTSRRMILVVLASTIFASLLFYKLPQIDISVSNLFLISGRFPMQKGEPAAVATDILHYGMRVVFFLYAGIGALLLVAGKAPAWLTWRRYLFVVLSVALASGLVTNVILKDHWGRARPTQIVQFGGDKQFSPAWVISDQCNKNCSFVGGDVSFAFCALAVALTSIRRGFWLTVAIGFGALIAIGRLAAGAHFFSDCVLAALITSLIVLCLQRWFGGSLDS